jgi:hypothetical protein
MATTAEEDEDVPELTTFQSREAYVYAPLPPAPHYGHRAEVRQHLGCVCDQQPAHVQPGWRHGGQHARDDIVGLKYLLIHGEMQHLNRAWSGRECSQIVVMCTAVRNAAMGSSSLPFTLSTPLIPLCTM